MLSLTVPDGTKRRASWEVDGGGLERWEDEASGDEADGGLKQEDEVGTRSDEVLKGKQRRSR